jgi:hypothetical protein
VATGLVGTFAMLYARYRGLSPGWVWAAIAAVLGVAALAAWWRGRSRFEGFAAARVRLEESLGLKARLTAAASGVGAWPERPTDGSVPWPVRWRWQRPLGWAALVAALLLLAARVPVSGVRAARGHLIEKPTDARVVEQWLDAVRREDAVEERSVERVRERIAELLERPSERWYEHASLEAAGTLREQTAAELQKLAENLAKAEQAAAQLAEMTEAVPQEVRDALAKDLRLAALALEMGGFKPPADLADLLRGMQDRDLGGLTPGEFRELHGSLRKKLAANRYALLQALSDSDCPCLDLDGIFVLGEGGDAPSRFGSGNAPGDGDGVNIPGGVGAVLRGRGDAELKLGKRHDLGTKRKEKVGQPFDPERAAPDELLAVVDGEHEVDETAYTGPQAGGTARAGDGGSAAQVDALLPAEQAAVRRFFE